MLQLERIAAGYGDVRVLWRVDFSLARGEIGCLIGPNGAGKTTLLRLIAGVVRAAEGTLSFDGEDLGSLDAAQRVGRGVVLVPEGRHLFAGLSVFNNLMLGAYHRRDGRPALRRDLERVYTLFPRLAERRRQDALTLSGGEQQMCAIARGLMAAPRLLLVDELSLGLAPTVVAELVAALSRVNAEGVTLLIIEQDVDTALELADHAVVLDRGRSVASGPASELADHPAISAAYFSTAPS